MTALPLNPTAVKLARPSHTADAGELNQLAHPGKGHSVLNTSFAAAADLSGRVADAFDYLLKLPKALGDTVSELHIPGVSWAASTVGSFFTAAFSAAAYLSTLGGTKWLQGLRRWTAVENGYADAFEDTEDLPTYTAKTFISSVRDPQLQADLVSYFEAHSKLQEVKLEASLSDEQRSLSTSELKRELALLEIKLARRAELLELQELIGADGDNHPATHSLLERLADQKASEMIAKIENGYKERLGIFGSNVEGVWLSVAAGGSEMRERIRDAIKIDLLSALEAEQRGESGQIAMDQARRRLHEAFLSSSMLREAGTFAGWGLLAHLGLHGFGVSFIQETVSDIGSAVSSALGWVWDQMAPDAVKEFVSQALLYAKLALSGVLAAVGAKGALTTYSVFKGAHDAIAGKNGVDAASTKLGGLEAATDIKAVDSAHIDTVVKPVDPLVHHLDAARSAALHGDVVPVHTDAASILKSHGVDTVGTTTLKPDVSTIHTHGELRVSPESVRPDVRIIPEVHIK